MSPGSTGARAVVEVWLARDVALAPPWHTTSPQQQRPLVTSVSSAIGRPLLRYYRYSHQQSPPPSQSACREISPHLLLSSISPHSPSKSIRHASNKHFTRYTSLHSKTTPLKNPNIPRQILYLPDPTSPNPNIKPLHHMKTF